jgi:hypothetical protein
MMTVYVGAAFICAVTFFAITITATTFVAAAITASSKRRALHETKKGCPYDKQTIKKLLHEMLPINFQFF